MPSISLDQIWKILDQISDPEIPVVSVVELGMIRSVGVAPQSVSVLMAPTFIGCPALDVIREDIRNQLLMAGAGDVQVKVTLRPPWTSDWITPGGRQKLEEFGLAPPRIHHGQVDQALEASSTCPFCGSADTILKNSFGSTLCRAIYQCHHCGQPFEQFKPV
jgi:ring-1,2-phenylacetyl-CoA epoxidase subunit PaaD